MDGTLVQDHMQYLESKYSQSQVTYSVTNNLTNCITDNSVTEIQSDDVYLAKITPSSGTIISIYVFMGGVDVTSDVYFSNEDVNIVSIGVITGDIVISATAQ